MKSSFWAGTRTGILFILLMLAVEGNIIKYLMLVCGAAIVGVICELLDIN